MRMNTKWVHVGITYFIGFQLILESRLCFALSQCPLSHLSYLCHLRHHPYWTPTEVPSISDLNSTARPLQGHRGESGETEEKETAKVPHKAVKSSHWMLYWRCERIFCWWPIGRYRLQLAIVSVQQINLVGKHSLWISRWQTKKSRFQTIRNLEISSKWILFQVSRRYIYFTKLY